MNRQRVAAAALVVSLVGCLNGCQDLGSYHSSAAGEPASGQSSSLFGDGRPSPPKGVAPISSADLTLPTQPSVARLQQEDGEHVSLSATAPARMYQTSKIRAVVNGSPILDEELREMVINPLHATEQLPEPIRSAKQAEILKAALEQLIERELIYTYMEQQLKTRPQIMEKLKEYAEAEFHKQVRRMKEGAHITSDEEFKAALEHQGISWNNLKRGITRNFMGNEFMRNRIFNYLDQLGLPQIRQYYEEHPGEFQTQDRVRWQDIFIDAAHYADRNAARATAELVVQRARSGADFAALVQEYDQGTSKGMPNGEGIGQERSQIRPSELEAPLFDMKAGEVGPIVEMPFGYHVFKLLQRDYAGRQPFDAKTQEEITKKVKGVIADREYKRLVNEIRGKATIQKFLDN